MLTEQGICRAHASSTIREDERPRLGHTRACGAGREPFRVAPSVQSGTVTTSVPIVVASRRVEELDERYPIASHCRLVRKPTAAQWSASRGNTAPATCAMSGPSCKGRGVCGECHAVRSVWSSCSSCWVCTLCSQRGMAEITSKQGGRVQVKDRRRCHQLDSKQLTRVAMLTPAI